MFSSGCMELDWTYAWIWSMMIRYLGRWVPDPRLVNLSIVDGDPRPWTWQTDGMQLETQNRH